MAFALLSKSRFISGLQCPLRLWYQCYEPKLAAEISPGQQAIFDTGHEVGRLATKLFPKGILIEEDHMHHREAEITTAVLLKNKMVRALFEGAFTFDGIRIQEWIDEYERHKKLLNLTGSIVLLCRDLNFTHGEYKDAIDHHLSIPIKAAGIPNRAYDMHTSEGKRKGRGLGYFFSVAGTVKNERKELKNDWEKVGKDAFYRANRQGFANDDRIIEATKVTKAAEAIKAAKAAKSAKRNRQAPTGVMPI